VGVIVAPVSPMNADLSLDLPALREVVDFLIDSGVHGLTPCAVTAETETLDLAEHRAVLEAVVDQAAGRVPVYCGIGRTSIIETRQLVDFVRGIAATGTFLIPPYATAHTVAEVVAYLSDIVGAAGLPTVLYNCPGYAKAALSASDIAALADNPLVVGVKEGAQEQLHDTLRRCGGSASVLTARDSYLLPSLAMGSPGIVSFAANVSPDLVVGLYQAFEQGDLQRARVYHELVGELVSVLVSRSYPLMIKAAMAAKGLPAGPSRRVATELSDDERRSIERVVVLSGKGV
jgi:4-hydroxy-tetrahydrodipicolinate synthase